jgi:hypothetical protein
MPIVRTVVRALIAGVLAIVGTGVAGVVQVESALAAQAGPAVHAQGQSEGSSQADRATPGGVAVSIDSIGPRRYAYPGATITVSGTITNDTGHPLAGAQVQLMSTSAAYQNRSDMERYASGKGTFYGSPILSAAWRYNRAELHSGVTVRWTVTFPAIEVGFTVFGVYPLDAVASSATAAGLVTQGTGRTLLPYWPSSGSASSVQKLDISWVWPLIDRPQQGACPEDLATNELATSLAPGGRLNGLLAAGLQYSASSRLTWAVDPALLSDASVMSKAYKVGGNQGCTGTTVMPASRAASTWLSQLAAKTAADPMFVTPYADPDVSALSHAGLSQLVAEAYSLGNSVAGTDVRKSLSGGTGIAWPDGGAADSGVLTTLAREGKIGTTVLSSTQMPTASYQDDAVAHVATGISTPMNVLLADSQISQLLGSTTASSSAGAQFAVEQDFLAETAQIVAEAPSAARSVVIAPPSRWDPSEAEAATLLSLTGSPWLRSVPLPSLATENSSISPAAASRQLPASQLAPQELSSSYIRQVSTVQQLAGNFASLLPKSSAITQSLSTAVAATASTAWRGPGSAGGVAALIRLEGYIAGSEGQVRIVSSGNTVLLGGTSGSMSVSVANGLPDPIEVRVHASVPRGSQLSVDNPDQLVYVPANQIKTVQLRLHSAALGSAQLQLQLLTRDGAPLAGKPEPPLTVETTRYGAALLILIAAALGVLVLTAMVRWVRRWLHDGGNGHHVSGRSDSQDDVREDGDRAGGTGAGGPGVSSTGVNSAGISNAGVSDARWSNAISGQRASGAGGGSGGTG